MADSKWGKHVVTWKALTATMLTIAATFAALAGYVLNLHASQPHAEAVSHSELHDVKDRMDRLDERMEKYLGRIEDKLDDLVMSNTR